VQICLYLRGLWGSTPSRCGKLTVLSSGVSSMLIPDNVCSIPTVRHNCMRRNIVFRSYNTASATELSSGKQIFVTGTVRFLKDFVVTRGLATRVRFVGGRVGISPLLVSGFPPTGVARMIPGGSYFPLLQQCDTAKASHWRSSPNIRKKISHG